jgi:hypothetical protein
MLLAFLLVLLVGGSGADNPCSGAGVEWVEGAGYFALDGSLETPDAIFNSLAIFPTGRHAALTNSSLDCTWVIHPKQNEFNDTEQNSTLRQVFVYIDVLLLGDGDSVTFYSNTSTSPAIYSRTGPYTGEDTLQLIGSYPGEPLIVRFVGTSATAKNLGAYFQAGRCLKGIQKLTQSQGTFSDGSGWAADYTERSDCGFLIGGRPNKLVSLSVQGNIETNFDFLYVRDGTTEDAPLVAIFSGENINESITSTSESLFVRFASDKSVIFQGFNATFALIDQTTCAGSTTLTAASKYFTDGSAGNAYPNNVDCEWWINPEVKVGVVNLYFSAFDVAEGDYVAIWTAENGTKLEELGRYHGSTVPNPIRHQGNELVVHFHTNGNTVGQGWAAVYSAGSCLAQGIAMGPRSGEVSDGSGSGIYGDSLSCSWLIDLSADPDIEKIEFEFTMFDLEYRFDKVAIYDGSSLNSPMVAEFTGSTANITGYATTQSKMLINFVTDSDTGAQGWRLKYNAVNFVPVSSDNSWIAAVVAVVVVVPSVVFLGCLLFAAFALWIWYRRSHREERLVEPDYYQLVITSTIEPLLFVSANSSLPPIKQDVNALAMFTALLLDPDFAQALILGAKKSHIEVDTVRISRLIMLTYIYAGRPLAILQAQLSRELRKASSKTMFREDTALTTMFKVWSKVEAMPYLWHSFAQLVQEVRHIAAAKNKNLNLSDSAAASIEVDPRRLTADDNNLLNTLQLELVVQKMLLKLFSSASTFPRELRKFCQILKKEIRKLFPRKAKKFYRMAVGNFLFLRLFCPALVDSFEYGLTDAPPDSGSLRLLVLISKVLQGIVTGSSFREDYMQNMNAFTSQNLQSLLQYLDDIARVDEVDDSDKSSEEPSLNDDDEPQGERNLIVRPEDLEVELDEFDLEVGLAQSRNVDKAVKGKRNELSNSQLQGIPEILRHNRKSLRVNRNKAITILCAFAVSVAPDVIDAIATTLPGKKKAKALERTFREVLPLLGDKGYSTGDDTGEDSDDDRL